MKKQTQKKLIYTRYILPPVLMLLMIATMFLPSYRYVMNGALEDAVSPMTLIANSYNNTRLAIFGTEDVTAESLLFSRNVLLTLGGLVLLSLIGIASALYACVVAVKYFGSSNEQAAEKSRVLFITLCPNRTVLCILNMLSLAVPIFPYITPFFYDQAYGARVVLTLTMPDTLIFAILSILAIMVLSIISAPFERKLGADLFKKRKPFEHQEERIIRDEEENEKSTPLTDEAREQNERIRRLLAKSKDDENQ